MPCHNYKNEFVCAWARSHSAMFFIRFPLRELKVSSQSECAFLTLYRNRSIMFSYVVIDSSSFKLDFDCLV